MVSHITLFAFIGLILFSAPFGESSVGTTPVLMWSNTRFFTGQNIQEIDVVSVGEITAAMRSQSNSLSSYINKQVTPEAIFVFVEPKLSSEQMSLLSRAHVQKPTGGSLSNLKKFIETSHSSLVLPYVASSNVGKEIVESLKSKGPVHTFNGQPDNVQISNYMSNGITDIIVVNFNSALVSMLDESAVASNFAADDAAIASWIALAKGAEYIAIFTANGADSKILDSEMIAEQYDHDVVFRDTFTQNGDLLYTTNWPVGIVEALIVMSPFLAILFIGICCTMQIQSDLKFDAEKMILRKQL